MNGRGRSKGYFHAGDVRCHSFNPKGFGSGPLTRGVSGRQERRAEESAKLAAERRGGWTAEASDSLQEQRLPISHPSAGVHPQILSAQKPSEVPPFPPSVLWCCCRRGRTQRLPLHQHTGSLLLLACSTQGTGETQAGKPASNLPAATQHFQNRLNEPTSPALCFACGLFITFFILLDLRGGFIPLIS